MGCSFRAQLRSEIEAQTDASEMTLPNGAQNGGRKMASEQALKAAGGVLRAKKKSRLNRGVELTKLRLNFQVTHLHHSTPRSVCGIN